MKAMLLNLWAWALVHPAEVSGAVVSALVALATVINARSKGAPQSWFSRFVDALAVRTRQGAKNEGWSLPLFGRSIFEAALDASSLPSDETPPEPRSPGFNDRSALVFVLFAAGALLAGRALTGCSARDAIRERVHPIGLYELQHPLHGRCHELGVRAPSEALNRELVVYGGVCVNALDAGAVSDAGASE